MKERPILFNGAMVRAILEGRKTQTRRIVKPQPEFRDIQGLFSSWVFKGRKLYPNARADVLAMCPFGQPGDQLWVRETWVHIDDEDDKFDGMGSQTYWHASISNVERDTAWLKERGLRWHPSIHMPRWATRITLEVTGVRVERLQDITEKDALAEGIQPFGDGGYHVEDGRHYMGTAKDSFASLWEHTNGADSWSANPWAWVIEFKRVEGTRG